MATYGMTRSVSYPFDTAIEKITEELKKEGFGILTTIDVQDTLKKKLDVDFRRYVILGACNPSFAHKVLQLDDQVGLLLPCNVVVQEKDNRTTVSVFDPMTMGTIMDNPEMEEIAGEVRAKLERALEAVESSEYATGNVE